MEPDDYWTAACTVLEGFYVENIEPLWGAIVSTLREEPLERVLHLHAVIDAENEINSGREAENAYRSRLYRARDRDTERLEAAEFLDEIKARYRF